MRALLFICSLILAVLADNRPCNPVCGAGEICLYERCFDDSWPVMDAPFQGRVTTDNILEPNLGANPGLVGLAGGGPDTRWMHLHRDAPGISNPRTLTITWLQGCGNGGGGLWSSGAGGPDLDEWEFRFVMGENDTPISDWLTNAEVRAGYSLDMTATIPPSGTAFDSAFPVDGIFHVSFEMRVAASGSPANLKTDYAPYPMYAHVRRDGFTTTTRTPIGLYEPDESGCADCCSTFSPLIPYVDSADRQPVGYPANPEVEPFGTDFYTARNDDRLYVEKLGPHSPLFEPVNMWWADPAHGDLPFIRPFPPKFSEATSWTDVYDGSQYDPATIRLTARHERFPMKDGPRGVGWMSAYVQGQVDSRGRFAFVETGGRLAYLYPDGTIHTIAGWVTDPEKDPVWIYKSKSAVRANQILKGTWDSIGAYDNGVDHPAGGFKLPMDVTYDPNNENELYVAGFEDHAIWKVTINSLSCDGSEDDVQVELFAGDPDHTNCIEGVADPADCEVDGIGTAARFNSPISIVFDPVCGCIYVADQVSSRIRKIDPATREVTTLFGANSVSYAGNRLDPFGPPGYIEELSPGADGWSDQEATCLENGAAGAPSIEGSGPDPLIFMPQTIRVTSTGKLIVLEHGYGTIREIDPDTGAAQIRARVHPKGGQLSRGWMWMDVDRWGNSGGLDSIYWCKFVGEVYGTDHGIDRSGDPACSYPNGIGMLKEPPSDDCGNEETRCTAACRSSPRHRCPDDCSANMYSEIYGWAPGNNDDGKSYMVFTNEWHQQFGLPMEVNPPHYPWLVAVDPRGAVLFAGAGAQGLVRMRMKRDDDPIPVNMSFTGDSDKYYPFWNGREIWEFGDPEAEYGGGPMSPSVAPHALFGWYGHNLLGLGADAYMTPGMSDEEVLDLFQVPNLVRDDPVATSYVLFFLRNNAGTTGDEPIEAVDPATFCPAAGAAADSSASSLFPLSF